ncbi:glutamate-cysteine ligase family protein [Accumulibacter sp.]|uniref:glutamate-cysteine ligase family protein n=1 Tax=Accumulibacter sp. TaxID=2053492 RepID=UPI0025D39E8F|nr:glutamate-cysteine ligase family protein [Accumulibacter sp.]MCM8596200.1 glutamate-cysteine ligase family protein [Accumulibacter sp.]MCM8626645.1 glutamate-cysteine ligase family protein [Accumulibacter sp.]MDS4050349.1 glutamate-cysteine ligase family protein [Accumulibacter sp.]
MGSEIGNEGFSADDFGRFRRQLVVETEHARAAFGRGEFAEGGRVAGFELEAWLIDRALRPAPHNVSFLERMASPLVVPELSRFNVEINGTPQPLCGAALSLLESELTTTWQRGLGVADLDEMALIAIGTLPTLRQGDLSLASMSPWRRYAMLNEQILRLREGRPLPVDIVGIDRLSATHADVMLEAATTSFQVHLQAPASEISRAYNASLILAGPLVALAANSPFLFGRALWHETRVPLFEQAVDGCDPRDPRCQRVTFGMGYLGADPTALFAENLANHTVLLPAQLDEAVQSYAHLRLHNGTIWRWNRLLIGFDEDHRPHLRVEQRVMPAGPSIVDMIANAALYCGAVFILSRQRVAPESQLPFAVARENFYRAARHGLDAQLDWLDGRTHPAGRLLERKLLPLARTGLDELDLSAGDITRYLEVIGGRLSAWQNGAAWQLAHYAKHQDLVWLTADYLDLQRRLLPVHEWPT